MMMTNKFILKCSQVTILMTINIFLF